MLTAILSRESPMRMASLNTSKVKENCRRHLKKVRQEISPLRREQASYEACSQLYQMTQHANQILSFASFGSEINLWPLNRRLAEEGRLVLPRMGKERKLLLFSVKQIDELESTQKGLLEPKLNFQPLDFSELSLSLIPGLGFDLHTKHRLGYGLGFYDHLLAADLTQTTWGVGFKEQAVEALPHSPHDIPLKQIFLF